MSAPKWHYAHALITGAGSGIGSAIALALAQQGVRVSLAGRSHDKLSAQAEVIYAHIPDASIAQVQMDVTDDNSVSAGVEWAQVRQGAVNILVNNAGQAHSQPFMRTDAAMWHQMIDVNLNGAFRVTQAVLPGMLASAGYGTPGRIINVASTAGLMGYAYVSAYVAAKHGVVGLTKALALELACQNITVNAVCPGYTETQIVQDAIRNIMIKTGQDESHTRKVLAARNPQQRFVQPHEVAQAVVWLCAAGSNAINGQAIAIDGGEQAG